MKYVIVCRHFIALIFLLIGTRAVAQTEPASCTIKGNIIDSATQKAVPFATLRLTDKEAHLIAAGVSKEDGSFMMVVKENPPAATLSFSATGYEQRNKDIDFTKNKTADLGNISMKIAAAMLDAVIVQSKAALIRQLPGRIEYNLQADPESKVKSMLDMMKKMPYLSVDGNDEVLFKGNKNFKIFINGKPSGMMDNNAKELLKSMPAGTIEKVEIITNPSSKYDAEGAAGIINIVTVKKISDGYNASVNVNGRFPSGGPGAGGSLIVKQGRAVVSAFGGGYVGVNPTANYQNFQTAGATVLQQNGSRKTRYNGGYFGTDMSYEINTLNLITVQFNTNVSENRNNDFLLSQKTESNTTTESDGIKNTARSHGGGKDVSVNYQRGFASDKNKLLTLSYRYDTYSNRFAGNTDIADLLYGNADAYTQQNNSGNSEQTIQADWVQNIKKVRLEAGLKSIFRKNTSEYSAGIAIDPDAFLNRQNIYGAYSSVSFEAGKWGFEAGLRLENTSTDISFTAAHTRVQQNYFNLIPNISINKVQDEHSSFGFAFSQRIKRPGVSRLNPFVNRSNPNFEATGNPYLKAVINNDVMANYSFHKKISFTAGLSYSFSNKVDLKISTYDAVRNVTKTTYENSAKASRLGIDYNLNYPVTKKLSMVLNGNIAQFFISGFADSRPVENNIFTYGCALSAGYQFGRGWQSNAGLELHGKDPAGLQNSTNGYAATSFSLGKSLFKNMFDVSAFINNPFSKYRESRTITNGYNFAQLNTSNDYFRAVGFSLNVKFGKLKDAVKNTKGSIRNNDVSN